MWQEHDVVHEDLERVCTTASVPWSQLHGKTVLVTGATGLIGAVMVKALLWYSLKHDAGVRVTALVRDLARAEHMFAAPLAEGAPLSFAVGDIADLTDIGPPVHYIVHGASVTASKDFVTRPVDTIRTAVRGTEQVLELARSHQVESMVYLSSMEVYGAPDGSRKVTESTFDCLDPLQARSSYSESKRMAEGLCAAYVAQHSLPVKVVRLSQTFGPGGYHDGRVFAQFARSAVQGRDIVLRTSGETERSCLYTADAVTAILTVLLRGQDGHAYNAANEATYASIRATAEMVARTVAHPGVNVTLDLADTALLGYAPTLKLNLDTTKLKALNWRPTVGLEDMYRRMVAVG